MFFKIVAARKVSYQKSTVLLSIWCSLFYQCEKVFVSICCLVFFSKGGVLCSVSFSVPEKPLKLILQGSNLDNVELL